MFWDIHKKFLCRFPQVVANETRRKGQDFCKFLKDFYNTPHLYKGIFEWFFAYNSKDFNIQIAKFTAQLRI